MFDGTDTESNQQLVRKTAFLHAPGQLFGVKQFHPATTLDPARVFPPSSGHWEKWIDTIR
jgi:hypothetical protein